MQSKRPRSINDWMQCPLSLRERAGVRGKNLAKARARTKSLRHHNIAFRPFARKIPRLNSDMQISLTELKAKIIESLKLQDITPEQIDDDAPLFGSGLGLDSIDALELVVMLEKNYGIVIKDIEEGRPAFRSVRTLGEFIQAKRTS
jgi:acyl carrier protein